MGIIILDLYRNIFRISYIQIQIKNSPYTFCISPHTIYQTLFHTIYQNELNIKIVTDKYKCYKSHTVRYFWKIENPALLKPYP